MRIRICILQRHEFPKKHLDSLFSSSSFEIIRIPLKSERDQVIEALETCPDKTFLVIVQDTSVTISNNVEAAIKHIVSEHPKPKEFDIFYLGKWLDRCDLYRNKEVLPNSTASVVATSCPQGMQAAIFSPRGRDIILGKIKMKNGGYFIPTETNFLAEQITNNILTGNITALCVVPNLFDFNVLEAKTDEDFQKTQACKEVPPAMNIKEEPSGWSNLWPYIILFLIILMIGICLFFLINRQPGA